MNLHQLAEQIDVLEGLAATLNARIPAQAVYLPADVLLYPEFDLDEWLPSLRYALHAINIPHEYPRGIAATRTILRALERCDDLRLHIDEEAGETNVVFTLHRELN